MPFHPTSHKMEEQAHLPLALGKTRPTSNQRPQTSKNKIDVRFYSRNPGIPNLPLSPPPPHNPAKDPGQETRRINGRVIITGESDNKELDFLKRPKGEERYSDSFIFHPTLLKINPITHPLPKASPRRKKQWIKREEVTKHLKQKIRYRLIKTLKSH